MAYNALAVLPSLDFGGSGSPLLFSHANGYPPGAYRRLLAALATRYHVQAMPARPLWAGSRPEDIRTWAPLVDDLLQYLDERGASGWIGVGHSLGAIVTAAAALRRPSLFRALVLIEPVFLHPAVLTLFGLFRRLGLAGRVHPLVPGARRRRAVFESQAAMWDRYRRAPVFAGLDDEALRDYVAAVSAPRADGTVGLAYTPAWETRIYETGPLNLWGQLHQMRPPMLAVRGMQTDTFSAASARALKQRLPTAEVVELAGVGHLAPLERPEEVATVTLSFLERRGFLNGQADSE